MLYPANLNYTWTISQPQGCVIRLRFEDFQLESGGDYVRVYDGPPSNENLLDTWTGTRLPSPRVSTGNTLTVEMHTNSLQQFRGFYAVYKTLCGSEIPSTSLPSLITVCFGLKPGSKDYFWEGVKTSNALQKDTKGPRNGTVNGSRKRCDLLAFRTKIEAFPNFIAQTSFISVVSKQIAHDSRKCVRTSRKQLRFCIIRHLCFGSGISNNKRPRFRTLSVSSFNDTQRDDGVEALARVNGIQTMLFKP
ncbi:tolloid-like protein 2 [Clonorchis sinensis]|uniref:Tolloid-like protein 2 n=1 Tax=Clonorchis sinensis TaxID=79923 RepID=G7Y2J5_CLOSI|nr:tolloid-like protein 2 [Clonorchis sinensis]